MSTTTTPRVHQPKVCHTYVVPPYTTPASEANWLIKLNDEPVTRLEAEHLMYDYEDAIEPEIADYLICVTDFREEA